MEAEDESRLRQRASCLIQIALCVLNATHLSVPSTVWYVRTLDTAQRKAQQFKVSYVFYMFIIMVKVILHILIDLFYKC